MNGAQCVPVCTCSTTRKWTLQLRHVCDFSTALAESWFRMGQSHILQQMFFPLRKWQVLKSAHCGSDSGKLIKAALRRAAGWVKARKLQTPFATHFASTYIFNPGLYTSVPLHHWLKLLNTTMGMGIFYQWLVLFHAEPVWRNSAPSHPGNVWVSSRNIWVFSTHSLTFQIHPPSLLSLDMPESGPHLQNQLQKLLSQEVRKSFSIGW